MEFFFSKQAIVCYAVLISYSRQVVIWHVIATDWLCNTVTVQSINQMYFFILQWEGWNLENASIQDFSPKKQDIFHVPSKVLTKYKKNLGIFSATHAVVRQRLSLIAVCEWLVDLFLQLLVIH